MTNNQFSGSVAFFRGVRLPEQATLGGYSALIDFYDLEVPLPRILFATGKRHRTTQGSGWHILTPRHAPQPSLSGHLFFSLKYEGLDLAVLNRLFLVKNNLPGTPEFCPLIFSTSKLQKLMGLDLKQKAQEIIQEVPKDVLSRCAAFLLLRDSRSSRASFSIEGEGLSHNRIRNM